MAEAAPFRLKLSGDTSDYHQFEGYDGYLALAGFAWTLSLATNFVETGKIRHRGDFPGRHAVRAHPIQEGSILVDFSVWLQSTPREVFGIAAVSSVPLLYKVVKRVISRNIGRDDHEQDPDLEGIYERKGGDFEALVTISEPSIRQTHSVIGSGADEIAILGGMNIIESLDSETLEYVKMNIEESIPFCEDVTVTAFDANHGYGRAFDRTIGRGVHISMARETLGRHGPTFSWALDQYTNKTGRKVRIWFTRILAADGRPKRYVITAAEKL